MTRAGSYPARSLLFPSASKAFVPVVAGPACRTTVRTFSTWGSLRGTGP
jgi:hypothetical protein